jgi:hypothetical protein
VEPVTLRRIVLVMDRCSNFCRVEGEVDWSSQREDGTGSQLPRVGWSEAIGHRASPRRFPTVAEEETTT